jgi:hypothetical protein
MASITAISFQAGEQKQNPRALFRQPLALQWQEDGHLKKRAEGERQAGSFSFFTAKSITLIDNLIRPIRTLLGPFVCRHLSQFRRKPRRTCYWR